jgi:hypothetical protein
MTNDTLPPHLEAIGRQLTAAAHDLSPAPRRSRRRALRLLAVSTTGLAAIATATVLAVGATTSTPPAFAVTRQHDGSVLVKINRRSGVTGANRKLAAMGIHKRLIAVRTSCSGSLCGIDTQSLPQNCLKNQQTGGVVDVIFPSAAAQQRAIVNGTYVPPGNAGNTGGVPQVGPWRVVACPSVYDAKSGAGNTGNTGLGNTGAG